MPRVRSVAVFLCVSLAVWAHAGPVEAFSTFPAAVPNGSIGGCLICHMSAAGGDARNAFGLEFHRGQDGLYGTADDKTWSRWLAGRDADGDGWSNGQELGDPFGYWSSGSASEPFRGYPGNAGSEPGNFNLCLDSGMNDCTSSSSGGNCFDGYSGSGRWNCFCDAGYTGDGYRRTYSHTWTGGAGTQRYYNYVSTIAGCYDINECSTMAGLCGAGSCTNLAGTYRCNCPSGYTAPSTGGTCSDVNECSTMPGICGVGSCTNTTGAYTCTCPVGYDFNGTTCVVTNACTANTDDCHAQATCTPQSAPTLWTCTCNPGWMGTGSAFRGTGDMCVDIDECAAGSPCGAGACRNSGGSYVCACPRGYTGPPSGGTCTDVDECTTMPGVCGDGTCVNTAGAYTCMCPAGYVFDGVTCEDVDECAANPCGPGSCVQSFPPPGYGCVCPAGYEISGGTCVDIDECSDPSLSLCSSTATCRNAVGSYRCVCDEGYQGDGFNCVDVDECLSAATNDCDLNARCTNTTGSYSCACREGYSGSGLDCADIDECARGTHGCGANELCVNRDGAVNDCVCAPGFARESAESPCAPACGNGERTPGEECDDGNTEAGDGCSERCVIEPGWACFRPDGGASECEETCGDGLVHRPFEECDDGDARSDTEPDACRTSCRAAGCGDEVIDTGERCDDGDANSDTAPDACRATGCVPAFCGDGVVDTGELCDPGGGAERPSAQCTSGCQDRLDAGVSVDAGDGGEADAGCGCRAVSSRSGGASLALLALLALILGRRRRRARAGEKILP